jgi:predicted glutamine amidotransferase
MCIAVVNPKAVTLKKQILQNCWDNNNDGAGILYVQNNKVVAKKEMTDFNVFYGYYQEAKRSGNDVILHFRIGTSGGVNEHNCHPFHVQDDTWFVHNGMLDVHVPANSPISDTQIFNNAFLKGLPRDFMYNDTMLDLIEYSIGNGNKFIFFNELGHWRIVNEQAGTWDLGCWFSNKSYSYSYKKPVYNNYNYGYGTAYQPSSTIGYARTYNDWDDTYVADVKSTYKWDSDDKADQTMCESCCELHDYDDMEVLQEFDNAMVCYSCFESMMYEMHGEDADAYIDNALDTKSYNQSFSPQPKSANDYLGW